MKKSKHGSKKLTLVMSLLLFWSVLSFSCPAYCSEATYMITETQLTTLEQNLTELKKQNQILQEHLNSSNNQLQQSKEDLMTCKTELNQSKSQIQFLKTQVTKLTNSLESANQSLSKLENNMSDKTQHSIGIGLNSDGQVAGTVDIKNTWIYVDKDDVAIGIKYKFYL